MGKNETHYSNRNTMGKKGKPFKTPFKTDHKIERTGLNETELNRIQKNTDGEKTKGEKTIKLANPQNRCQRHHWIQTLIKLSHGRHY